MLQKADTLLKLDEIMKELADSCNWKIQKAGQASSKVTVPLSPRTQFLSFYVVFYCCCNKSPQSSCLKRAQIYYLTALGVRILKTGLTVSSKCPEGCILLEALGENLPFAFRSFWRQLAFHALQTPCSYGITWTSVFILTPPSPTLILLFLHIF